MNEKLKKITFKKLYEDLSKVEIIHHEDSIWFIDREQKYWYFEYEKSGVLWWRYDFFTDFFNLFSSERNEFEPVISEWVEEVLNCKVNTSEKDWLEYFNEVEEVLNYKVNTTCSGKRRLCNRVAEILNHETSTTN